MKARNGTPVGVCCALGQLFMKQVDRPWRAVDEALAQMPSDVKVRLVDFHAEATSEMQIMGRYLDGRASAVLGTHTHIPTADLRHMVNQAWKWVLTQGMSMTWSTWKRISARR